MISALAHAAGTVLRDEFHRQVQALGGGFGEVALFRALSDALGAWRVPNLIETTEYHGRTHQVEHQALPPVRQLGAKWCELCDIVIVSYGAAARHVRLTFLQAKYERRYLPINGTGLGANMVQWSLLGGRARITDHVSTFEPPPPADLLSSAVLPSIASFGFFYPGPAGLIELAFASADRLTAHVSPRRANIKYGELAFPVPPQPPAHSPQCRVEIRNGAASDLSVAFDLQHFGAGLSALLVGSPVVPGTVVGRWLSSFVSHVAAERGTDDVLAGLAEALDAPTGDNGRRGVEVAPGEEPGSHPTLVVVRTRVPLGEG